jgi:hypothetical protein
MKFDYRDFPRSKTAAFPHETKVSRPTIKVKIQYQDRAVDLYSLVDSGADYSIFPSSIGKSLGIDIFSGEEESTSGIGGTIKVYFHRITLIVEEHALEVRAGFSDRVPWPCLGQLDFFEHFEVRFNYRERRIVLIPQHEQKKRRQSSK